MVNKIAMLTIHAYTKCSFEEKLINFQVYNLSYSYFDAMQCVFICYKYCLYI